MKRLLHRVEARLHDTGRNIARMESRIAMGKMKENPKYNVFTLRADDDLAERIREAAKRCANVSDFLETAAREKIHADEDRVSRSKVDGRLGR